MRFFSWTWTARWPIRRVPPDLLTPFASFLTHYGLALFPLTLCLAPSLIRSWRAASREQRTFWLLVPLALGLAATLWLRTALIPALVIWSWLVWRAWGRAASSVEDVFVAALSLTGAILVIGCELFYFDDIFEGDDARINTVFKIHYFVWTAWTLAGVAAWNRLIEPLGASREACDPFRADPVESGSPLAAPAAPSVLFAQYGLSGLRIALFALALAAASVYPVAGLIARSRLPRDVPPDGLGALARRQFELDGTRAAQRWGLEGDDLAVIRWLAAHTTGQTFVCEAGGPPYTERGRIATYAGTCAPMAWDQHLTAWNSPGIRAELDYREDVVQSLYRDKDFGAALMELSSLGMKYVVVGRVELRAYGRDGAAALAALAEPVFSHGDTRLYAMSDLARALLGPPLVLKSE